MDGMLTIHLLAIGNQLPGRHCILLGHNMLVSGVRRVADATCRQKLLPGQLSPPKLNNETSQRRQPRVRQRNNPRGQTNVWRPQRAYGPDRAGAGRGPANLAPRSPAAE
jgi:hypothetical protein